MRLIAESEEQLTRVRKIPLWSETLLVRDPDPDRNFYCLLRSVLITLQIEPGLGS